MCTCYLYESVNVQQTVDFNQGTLNNLVVVNNKLQLPSVDAPSFTRNSIAYKSDGTLVNTNLPRYETGKFGKAVMVEEGTTNLVKNPSFESTTDWGALNRTTEAGAFHGDYACKVTYNWVQNQIIAGITDGQTYTISAYGKNGQGGDTRLFLRAERSDGTSIQFWEILWRETNWTRKSLTITTPAETTRFRVYLTKSGGEADYDANYGYIDAVQLEQKPYATSFIDGTRAAETLTIPTAGVLNKDEGTIELWINPITLQNWNNFFDMSISTGRFILFFNSDGVVHWDYGPSNSGLRTGTGVAVAGQWLHVAMRWSASKGSRELFVNGQYIGTKSFTPPDSLPATVSVVNNYGALIDDLRISSCARTDAEIAAAYQSGQPLPVDEWTTYLMRFDSNLNFGQGGYYISPEYDLSAVGTAATSAISWQEDADGIQRTVYAKLDNQSDWTQVVNGGKLPINPGDVLTGRKLQLKAKLLQVV